MDGEKNTHKGTKQKLGEKGYIQRYKIEAQRRYKERYKI